MRTTSRLGYWAAQGAFIASATYVVAQLLQIFGILKDPFDRVAIFAPSLVLAPLFVVMLAAAYLCARPEGRGWRLAALALGLLYAAMTGIVYVNQLGVVIPDELHGLSHDLDGLACCTFREPMTAIDLLGYTYMAGALLLLAPTYRSRFLRIMLVANGLLAPAILLQLYWWWLLFVAAAWLGLFPLTMALIARDFAGMRDHHGRAPRSG